MIFFFYPLYATAWLKTVNHYCVPATAFMEGAALMHTCYLLITYSSVSKRKRGISVGWGRTGICTKQWSRCSFVFQYRSIHYYLYLYLLMWWLSRALRFWAVLSHDRQSIHISQMNLHNGQCQLYHTFFTSQISLKKIWLCSAEKMAKKILLANWLKLFLFQVFTKYYKNVYFTFIILNILLNYMCKSSWLYVIIVV